MDPDALVPPNAPAMSAGRVLARKEQVMTAIMEEPRPVRSPRRRRMVVLAMVAAVLVGGSATAAYALLKPAPITQLSAGVGCFEEASLHSDVAQVDLKGLDPIARCEEVWADGAFGAGRTAPALIACVYPSGALAIMPGKNAADCEEVGLPQPLPGQIDLLVRFDALKQTIFGKLDACPSVKDATELVLSELRSGGHTGWTVELGSKSGLWDEASDPDRICRAHFIDERKVAVLINGPGRAHA